jgi:hypothetical protein
MAIDSQMETVVEDMISTQKAIAEACAANGDRPWFNFENVTVVGKFDFEGIHELFKRDNSNDDYARFRGQPDTKSKDIQTCKLSADFLAGCERDYRMRTRSRVRMLVHGTVVSPQAMGESEGPLRRNTLDWLGRILAETSGTE